jgi:hypothetical protein
MKSKAYDKLIQYRLFELVTTPWNEQEAYKKGIVDEMGSILVFRRNLSLEQKKAYPSPFYAHAWAIKQVLEQSCSMPIKVGRALSKLFDLREEITTDMVSPRKIDEVGTKIFEHYGIDLLPMLEENYDALPVSGSYKIDNLGYVDLKQAIFPVGDIAGFPVYRIDRFDKIHTFTMLEAKRMNNEDGAGTASAPANNVGGGNIAGVSPGQEPPGPKGGFKALAKMKKKRIAQLRRDARTLNVVAAEKKNDKS